MSYFSSSPPDISGKRVLITGGTSGVGKAAAHLLVSQGCRVFICGRREERLTSALAEIGGDSGGVVADVGSTEGVVTLFRAADAFLGGLDFVVLNAGIPSKGELTEMTREECCEVVAVNLLSHILCAREAIGRMSGKGGGHLVFIGSMSADIFDTRASVYVATKAGLRGFAASLRKEANPLRVKVSVLEPGTIGSDMVDETPEQKEEMIRDLRMLRPEEVAETILFLLTRPEGCDIIKMQVRPHLQLI